MKNEATPIGKDPRLRMSPEQKLRAALLLISSARELKAAAIRTKHPDWSEEQIKKATKEAFLYA